MKQSPLRMGNPPSWKVVDAMVFTSPIPPLTYFGFFRKSPTLASDDATVGSLNGIAWETHFAYTSGPFSRTMKSSSQSVAGHPVASPEPMPAHQGFLPVAAILSESATISS